MERRFTRFRRTVPPGATGVYPVPGSGMCLSAFLVLHPPGRKDEVLLGRLNADAPWLDLGALEPERVRSIGRRWMLPSSHLLFFECPDDAVRRICREQLTSELPRVDGPRVFSDPYPRTKGSNDDPHWDLHFVYVGDWPTDRPPASSAWSELKFVDVTRTDPGEIARAQADILDLVGGGPGVTGAADRRATTG